MALFEDNTDQGLGGTGSLRKESLLCESCRGVVQLDYTGKVFPTSRRVPVQFTNCIHPIRYHEAVLTSEYSCQSGVAGSTEARQPIRAQKRECLQCSAAVAESTQ